MRGTRLKLNSRDHRKAAGAGHSKARGKLISPPAAGLPLSLPRISRPELEEGAPPKDLERRSYDDNTAFSLYLREIGQVKLLTTKEENQLAARIKKGDQEAREWMIKANLRLVVHIAREYEHCGAPLLDLINEGNIGLMKAVERFDPAKGAKFSTYASLWIKQAIRRALADQAKTIRLPVNAADTLYRMRKTAVRLQEDLGREPSDEELAQEMGLSARRVTELNVAALRPASLDASIGDEDSSLLGEVVEDEKAVMPDMQLEEKTSMEVAHGLLDTLDPRAALILRFRFGLDGKPEKTLEEIGKKFGLTRERIRQLQNEALSRLRRNFDEMDTVQAAA
jgi:RNA polymerase primary sigma factor